MIIPYYVLITHSITLLIIIICLMLLLKYNYKYENQSIHKIKLYLNEQKKVLILSSITLFIVFLNLINNVIMNEILN